MSTRFEKGASRAALAAKVAKPAAELSHLTSPPLSLPPFMDPAERGDKFYCPMSEKRCSLSHFPLNFRAFAFRARCNYRLGRNMQLLDRSERCDLSEENEPISGTRSTHFSDKGV